LKSEGPSPSHISAASCAPTARKTPAPNPCTLSGSSLLSPYLHHTAQQNRSSSFSFPPYPQRGKGGKWGNKTPIPVHGCVRSVVDCEKRDSEEGWNTNREGLPPTSRSASLKRQASAKDILPQETKGVRTRSV